MLLTQMKVSKTEVRVRLKVRLEIWADQNPPAGCRLSWEQCRCVSRERYIEPMDICIIAKHHLSIFAAVSV